MSRRCDRGGHNALCRGSQRFQFLDAVTEVATIRFVAAHTTIPVPRPLCTFEWRGGEQYIAMSRVPGVDLKKRKWQLEGDWKRIYWGYT